MRLTLRMNKFFFWGYVLYFLALFLPDLAIVNIESHPIIKILKYISYVYFFLSILGKGYNWKKLEIYTVAFVFSALYFVATRDFYYTSLVLVVLAATKEDPKEIIRLNYILLLVCASFTMVFMLVGILPNSVHLKMNGLKRMGLGYYHSNVFPLVVFYLLSYRIILKKFLSGLEIFLFSLISITSYYFCFSRSGLVGSILLIVWCIGAKVYHAKKDTDWQPSKVVTIAFRYSILIVTTFSMVMMLLQKKGIYSIYVINQMFSGRFALAYHKMNDIGLHFINLMKGDQFLDSEYVLDSGYLYVVLRYGILFILFYCIIQYLINKKYSNAVSAVFFVTTITNLIDNDLFSYGFFPFILIAFNLHNLHIKALEKNLKLWNYPVLSKKIGEWIKL